MTLLLPIRDHNPYKRFPFVTVAIIALNVYVFLVVGVSQRTVFQYGAVPCELVDRCSVFAGRLEQEFPGRSVWLTLFTSMFMHGGFAHLFGNMLYLWVFGNNVEDELGHVRYVLFYLVCGLAAAAAHIAISSGSPVPIVGASGAISGVLGAYLVLFPKARVVALAPFFFFVEVSAALVLGLWFVLQLLNALGSLGARRGGGGVAFAAHVGGFVAGWLLIRLILPGAGRRRPVPEPDDDLRW